MYNLILVSGEIVPTQVSNAGDVIVSTKILGTNLIDTPVITCIYNSTISLTGYSLNHVVSCPTPSDVTGMMGIEVMLDSAYSLGVSDISIISIYIYQSNIRL